MRISDWSSDVCSSDLLSALDDVLGTVPSQPGHRNPIAVTQLILQIDSHVALAYRRLVVVEGRRRVGRVDRIKGIDQRHSIGRLKRSHRSEEHTSELQSLMRISYAVFCLKKKKNK